MPTYNVTDPNSGATLKLTGDSPPTEEELEQIFSQQAAPEITSSSLSATTAQPEPSTEKPEGSILHAVAEPALAVASGLVGTVAGGLGGLATSAFSGVDEGVKTSESIQSAASEFGAPETKAGQKGLETLGDIMQKGIDIARFPISGLAGIAELISGQGIDQATKTIKDIQEKGVGQTAGDRAFEITGDPLIATVAGISPEIIGSLIPLTKMAKTKSALRVKIADQIKSGSTDKQIAKYMINGSGKVKVDKLAKETIKQGFDQGVVSVVKGSSDIDRIKMSKMVDIMKKGKENALFATKNRPSDVVGDSLLSRVNHIKKVNIEAGKELDSVAKSLRGKAVDFNQPINNFIDNLDDIGVKINDSLKPVFKGSDIEGLAGPESAINLMVNRLKSGARGKAPDAYDLHRVKKYIDENVTYGKSGEGLKGKTERILKQLRRDIDSTLDAEFPKYDAVNTTYADTVGALDALQDVAGKKMKLFGPQADKATGTLLRRMMSNAQSRINLVDAVDNIESVAKKYGGKFDDDITTLMVFADELDNVFGPVAKTSLAGETVKSIRRGTEAAAGQRTGIGVALDIAETGYEKFRGINQEGAFRSMAELLKRK